jgi:hypothetical protein
MPRQFVVPQLQEVDMILVVFQQHGASQHWSFEVHASLSNMFISS